jgi:hypothetical protein
MMEFFFGCSNKILPSFERLALLCKLEILNRGYSITPSLSELTSLDTLSLAMNSFQCWNTLEAIILL